MKYQYYFYELYKAEIEEYLKEKQIHYKKNESNVVGDSLVFSVWSNTRDSEMILRELKHLGVGDPLVFASYSASEINNAKFLVMRGMKQKIDIMNCENAYHYSCRWTTSMGVEKVKHEEQIDRFTIRKEPSTKTTTAFWSEDTGHAELFTDKRVCELVTEQGLKGIEFENVIDRKGVCSENIFQVKSPHLIKRDCIEMGHGERKVVCHICGKEQFFINDIFQLHLDFSKLPAESDLYITERMWGEGIAYPLYIISQRFYQLLKQNKLIGGINFSPVVGVN